jgi:peptidoglycan/LPS O-acetylase OafA/YrhL
VFFSILDESDLSLALLRTEELNLMPTTVKAKIPSLDGIRALAVMSIFYGHLAGTRGAFPLSLFNVTGDLGNLGVRAFFVLSGFLITTLLLREKERTGTVSLNAFYKRRALRLLPVFYSVLTVAALLTSFGVLYIPRLDFLRTGVFLTNFFNVDWNLGHFWSLAIEEQFYFVWPTLLLVLGPVLAVRFALVAFLLTPFLHVIAFKLGSEPLARYFLSINALSIGCALAGLRSRLHGNKRYMQLLRSPLVWPVAVSLVLANMWGGHFSYICAAYSSLALAFFIDRVSTIPTGIASFLNWKPMVFISGVSYSLYAWQQIFLDRYAHLAINAFPLNLLLAVTCGVLSFLLLERPVLRYRESVKARKAAFHLVSNRPEALAVNLR